MPDLKLTDPLPTDLVSGVYELDSGLITQAVADHFAQDGWAAAVVDLRGTTDKTGILEAFAHALAFPSWVGRNWDALDDALADLSWWPDGPRGRLVLVHGATEPASFAARADRRTLGSVLESAVASWALTESPLVVLLAP